MPKSKIIGWTSEKKKDKINGFINDGLAPEKSVKLAFLTEKKERKQLSSEEFSEYVKLFEKHCCLRLKKRVYD